MLKSAAALLLLSSLPAAAQAPRVAVDPRVELLSVVFRLAGNSEYNQGRVKAYNSAIDQWFGPFKDHEAVKMARDFRDRYGVGYDAPMALAFQLKDLQSFAERIPLDSPESQLDQRWHGAEARPFVAALKKFAADTQFEKFLDSQANLYGYAGGNMRALVDKEADFAWFDSFFGTRARQRFTVVPALVNGPANYGPGLRGEDGVNESYAVIGAWDVNADGMPTFRKEVVGTIVHEVIHSYANPLIDQALDRIDGRGAKILVPVAQAMRRQAYGEGATVLRESLVRACSARYSLAHGGETAARSAIEYERSASFLWTGELFDLLGEYEKDRVKYPTLEAFMPRVAEYFNGLGPRVQGMVDALEAGRPKVVSITPADGTQNVDPTLTEIVIKFDRPMRKTSYQVMQIDTTVWPNVGKVGYDETGTVFTMQVKLEPAHDYAFGLNNGSGGSFRSAEGTPLAGIRVRFRTGPAR
jgi:hypothetical protein